MNNSTNFNIVFLCFLIASIASLGSFFFSEVMKFIPCSMCWYQRIFMYPLVFIFSINMLCPDKEVVKYSLPLVLIGFIISIYHNLLMWDIIPETIVPCVSGVPCSTVYINWFDFITIPLLSLSAYSSIFILLLILKRKYKNEK